MSQPVYSGSSPPKRPRILPKLELLIPNREYQSTSTSPLKDTSPLTRKVSWSGVTQTSKAKKSKLKEGLQFLEKIGYSDPSRSVSSKRSISYGDFIGKQEAHKLIRQLGYIEAVPIYNKLHSSQGLKLPNLPNSNPTILDQIAKAKASMTDRSPRKQVDPGEAMNDLRKQLQTFDLNASQKKTLDILTEKLAHFKQSYTKPEMAKMKRCTPTLTDKEMRSFRELELRLR